MLACGSPVSHVSLPCRTVPPVTSSSVPQSIIVCPAAADAKDFPDGEVQFVAIGTFQTAPSPALLKAQVWGVCQQNNPTSAVSITNSGLAQCGAGASGEYSVFASDMTNCLAIGPCGTGCFVSGYAKLTCP
jgi:hypothetical protein